ncbi:hypothetical protein ACVWXL_009254 [Bradyrhizobium sp. GM22.5]
MVTQDNVGAAIDRHARKRTLVLGEIDGAVLSPMMAHYDNVGLFAQILDDRLHQLNVLRINVAADMGRDAALESVSGVDPIMYPHGC